MGAQVPPGNGTTARKGASTLVVRFSAMPTITVPSAETALAKTSCQPPLILASTSLRSSIPLVGVQRNALVRPSTGALPTTTEPSAETPWAPLSKPRSPRSCMPPAAVQRKAWVQPDVQPAIPDCPTTTEPLDEAAAAVAGPWPRLPRSCTTPARQRKACPRNVVLSYDIPTITLPSAETAFAWPCNSLGSGVRNSKLGGAGVVKRKVRVQPPKTPHWGSVPDRKYLPMTT